MVDDYFAEGWPGVSEGVHAFMVKQQAGDAEKTASAAQKLVPFFIGFNKVLFAAEDFGGSYQDALMSGQHLIGLVCPCHPYHPRPPPPPPPATLLCGVCCRCCPGLELTGRARDRDTGDGTIKVKMQLMFGFPVVVMTEEVHCRKKTRTLLPGEECPAGLQCS